MEIIGGEGPYIIQWSDGADTEDRTDLGPGRYEVTVTDQRGCTVQDYAYIRQVEVLVYPVEQSDPTCAGDADGSIQLKVYNGTAPYDYRWSDGATGESRTDLAGGSYTVTVTDANDCEAERTIELLDPDPIAIVHEVVPPGCDGQTGFEILVHASGGTGNLSYQWARGASGPALYNVDAGSYTVTVTDENGCVAVQEILAEGGAQAYDCLITAPQSKPACGSAGNMLDAMQEGVLTYTWQLVSTDNNWLIEGAADGPQISYTAGNTGSSATFYLDVVFENGCSASCELTLVTCEASGSGDPGDDEEPGDPGEEDPPGSGCTDCFEALPVHITREGNIFHYTITVGTSEPCRHDLSHVVIGIPPCAVVTKYGNSMDWKMEGAHTDPTSGLYGIKVDDIPVFGKDAGPASFRVTFSLTSSDPDCLESLACYFPTLAYKAAQCVSYQQSTGSCAEPPSTQQIDVYPNPTEGIANVSIDGLRAAQTFSVQVFSSYGILVQTEVFEPGIQHMTVDLSGLTSGLYIIKIIDETGESVIRKILRQ